MIIGSTFPIFRDNNGNNLESGSIYFGVPNLNPETNPIAVYWDSDLTQPAAQPVKTLNGFIVRDGTISQLYCNSTYSITVKNKKGELIFNFPDSTKFDPNSYLPALYSQPSGSSLVGFIQSGNNAQATNVQNKLRERISFLDFGAIGDGIAEDAAKVQNAINTGATVIDGCGKTYLISTNLAFNQPNQKIVNCTLLFNGSTTARLADISADNVTFENVVFNGNQKQPRSCLIAISANVKNPRFYGCTFKKLTGRYWGTNVLNAMYAVSISPYGVTNFEFKNCLFQDLIKYNDGINTIPVTPAFVGGGFVGGIIFLNEDLSEPTAVQTVVTQGVIDCCTFDNIQTIRAVGLSVSDQIEFNDADAIRTYGYTGGGENLYVHVSNCIFKNVSKRCFKFRAAGSIAENNECYASDLPYNMTSPVDLTSNSEVINLKIYASSSMPVYNAVTWSVGPVLNRRALIDNLFVTHCVNGVNFFSNPSQDALNNLEIKNCYFNQCVSNGIVQSAPIPLTMDGIAIENVKIYGASTAVRGIAIIGPNGSPTDVSSGLKLKNVYIQNADVYIDAVDNDISDLTIEITSNTFNGYSSSATLLRIGKSNVGGFQNVENVFVNAWNLNTGYLNATRQVLVDLSGDNAVFKNFRLVVPQGLGTTYAHCSISGCEVDFNGLFYDGPGRVNFGTEFPVSRCTISNAVRLSNNGSACSEAFLYTDNAATAQVMLNNITDFRPTTQPSIIINNGSQFIVYNVGSKTSNGTIVQHGGLAKTANINTF